MEAKSQVRSNWKILALFSLIGIIVSVVAAIVTRLWLLTALPIGFLFGFFLQKGDLCGSSAFSEVLLLKNGRKVFGLWVLIVVSMLGFAALDLLHLVTLAPKPFLYLNYIIGGVIFGAGMVLSGGCVSGCLYKSATGNLNSMIALLPIGLGIMIVEYGPLHGLIAATSNAKLSMPDGKAISLNRLLGIPFWTAAVIIAAISITAIIIYQKRTGRISSPKTEHRTIETILTRSWKPWAAGIAIGLLMIPAYLSSAASGRNYPLGVSHGVMQAELLLIDKNLDFAYGQTISPPQQLAGQPALATPPANSGKKIVWWLVALIFSLVSGSFISAKMSGQAKLLPKPADEMLFALLGGLLVGIGAGFASGCVVGNIMSGWGLLSVGMFVFGLFTILSNWAMTKIYLIGLGNRH